MNLELCKSCPHCSAFPRTDAELNERKHRVYHCELALRQRTKDGEAVFNADNPTNLIAEESEHPQIDPSTKERTFKLVVEPKKMFKVPQACPCRGHHGA